MTLFRKNTKHARKLSEYLSDLAALDHDRISIGTMIETLGPNAQVILTFLFGVLNVIPSPPGMTAITGLPLILLSWRMMRGLPPALPAKLRDKTFSRDNIHRIIQRVLPTLIRLEGVLRPRLAPISDEALLRIAGALIFGLSILIFLPIPFVNMLPALAIAVITLGLLERDGLVILTGAGFGIGSFVIACLVYGRLIGMTLGIID